MTDYMLPAVWLVFFSLWLSFFERLCSISITFGVNSQAYGVDSKGYGDNSKGLGDRNLLFCFPYPQRRKGLVNQMKKTPPPAFRPEWRSFDIYEIWTKFEQITMQPALSLYQQPHSNRQDSYRLPLRSGADHRRRLESVWLLHGPVCLHSVRLLPGLRLSLIHI